MIPGRSRNEPACATPRASSALITLLHFSLTPLSVLDRRSKILLSFEQNVELLPDPKRKNRAVWESAPARFLFQRCCSLLWLSFPSLTGISRNAAVTTPVLSIVLILGLSTPLVLVKYMLVSWHRYQWYLGIGRVCCSETCRCHPMFPQKNLLRNV